MDVPGRYSNAKDVVAMAGKSIDWEGADWRRETVEGSGGGRWLREQGADANSASLVQRIVRTFWSWLILPEVKGSKPGCQGRLRV